MKTYSVQCSGSEYAYFCYNGSAVVRRLDAKQKPKSTLLFIIFLVPVSIGKQHYKNGGHLTPPTLCNTIPALLKDVSCTNISDLHWLDLSVSLANYTKFDILFP